MEVALEEHTPEPEKLVCKAARNDYSNEGIQSQSFEEIMEGIEPASEVPEEAYAARYAEDFHEWSDAPHEEERKMWTLISHLLDHGHFGPFEHPQFTFSVNGVSRSLMAQLTRHRHASFDVQSMRYVSFQKADPEPGEAVVEIPEFDEVNPSGRNVDMIDHYKNNVSDENLLNSRRKMFRKAIEQSFNSYKSLLQMGVAPENARMVLPIGTKINIVFSVNARMLMHIADMRAAGDAQWEIREMTEAVLDEWAEVMPMTAHYYEENLRNRKNRLAP